MRWLKVFAGVVLCLQVPIPLYWLIVHPCIQFWRRHVKAAYWIAALPAWGGVAALFAMFYRVLLVEEPRPGWVIAAGVALIVTDLYMLVRVERALGGARLVGRAELQGAGELATGGLYAMMRHPRYTGMMLSVAGACLISGSRWLWLVVGIWWVLALCAVLLEEKELHGRFGEAYAAYCRRVPRFLPFRLRPREE